MKVQKDFAISYLLISGLSTVLNILCIIGLIERRIAVIGFLAVLICTVLINIVKIRKNIKTSIIMDIELLFENATNINVVRVIYIACIAIWGSTYILVL